MASQQDRADRHDDDYDDNKEGSEQDYGHKASFAKHSAKRGQGQPTASRFTSRGEGDGYLQPHADSSSYRQSGSAKGGGEPLASVNRPAPGAAASISSHKRSERELLAANANKRQLKQERKLNDNEGKTASKYHTFGKSYQYSNGPERGQQIDASVGEAAPGQPRTYDRQLQLTCNQRSREDSSRGRMQYMPSAARDAQEAQGRYGLSGVGPGRKDSRF